MLANISFLTNVAQLQASLSSKILSWVINVINFIQTDQADRLARLQFASFVISQHYEADDTRSIWCSLFTVSWLTLACLIANAVASKILSGYVSRLVCQITSLDDVIYDTNLCVMTNGISLGNNKRCNGTWANVS